MKYLKRAIIYTCSIQIKSIKYNVFIYAEHQHRGPPSRRKGLNKLNNRRVSNAAPSAPTTLVIPQLDAIQRSQKLLDVRLQHLQTNSKLNEKIIDDIEFLRRVMTENQKALLNIIQSLGNMQSEIVNIVKCFAPSPPPTITTVISTNNQSNTFSQPNAHHHNSLSKFGSGRKRQSHPSEDESEV